MSQVVADRNRLFGALALRMGLIGPELLESALEESSRASGRPLEQILMERGGLARAQADSARAAMGALLDSHGGDAGQALRSLGPGGGGTRTPVTLQNLSTLADDPADGPGDEAGATRPLSLGPDTVAVAPIPAPDLGATVPDGGHPGAGPVEPPAATVAEDGVDRAADPDGTCAYEPAGPAPLSTRSLESGPPTMPLSRGDGSRPAGTSARLAGDGTSAPSRYKILRPHARGGLGEVFVAIDQELSREVALKEIKGRHADDPHSRSRFVLEAEVTGGLEHPGIVPVYGLGHYPDGRPYYAMRFIRGETLKEAVDRFHEADRTGGRDPGARALELRALLGQFIAVCNAIAYAHSRGVIHRDLKPANVMIGAFGETLVVDWGLAKATGHVTEFAAPSGPGPLRPLSGSGAGATLHGSTIGTPHFMSPEQAEGHLDRIGPASDLYSLGATLYYLLTGTTPFRDPTLASLLHKVKTGDFPPPRAVNSRVPPALEAICLKAMALRPEDRYLTARALAEDVEHWLGDEPVSAYREPFSVRLARWARRHRTLVVASAALLVAAVVGLSLGAVLLGREQRRTAAQRDRAEANFALARRAVETGVTELGAVELVDVPRMEPARRRILEQALIFYLTFLRQKPDDLGLRREAARAYLRAGDIQEMLGDYAAAEPSYRQAIDRLRALVVSARDPAEADEFRRDLAHVLHQLGVLLKKANRFEESEEALSEALRLRKALAAAAPGRDDLEEEATETVYQIGTLLARLPGTSERVRRAYDEAIRAQQARVEAVPDRPDSRRKLAKYQNNLGILVKSEDARKAEPIFERAVALSDDLAKASPTVAGYQWDLARARSNLGTTRAAADLRSGEPALVAARDGLARLVGEYPGVPDYRSELAAVEINLGLLRQALGQVDLGLADLDAAIGRLRALVKAFPGRPDYRLALVRGLGERGIVLARVDRKDEAEAALAEALDVQRRLVADFPGVPAYHAALASALANRAVLLNDLGRGDEAIRLLERAVAEGTIARDGRPRDERYGWDLIAHRANLAALLAVRGRHAEAAAIAEEISKTFPNDPRSHARSARVLARCAAANDAPEGYARRAVTRLRKAVDLGLRDPGELDAPDYAPLHGRDDFEAIREELRRRKDSET